MKSSKKTLVNLKTNVLVLTATSLLAIPQYVLAHGYISQPESRSYKCKLGENSNCGPIKWEPQSVEGPDRFPSTGPADGTLAAGGNARFSQLNAQSTNRWAKARINSGRNNFTWTFTAPHATRDYRYFITRNGWNQNQRLSRSSFESQPFCTVNAYGDRPPSTLTHSCVVPSDHSGYHVIFAVWDVSDTSNSFYQAVDVIINNAASVSNAAPSTTLTSVGDIYPSMDLNVGDRVKTRIFNDVGELPEKNIEIVITSSEQGNKNVWPSLLAQTINSNSSELTAGQLDHYGQTVTSKGENKIFVNNNSEIVRVEIQIIQD